MAAPSRTVEQRIAWISDRERGIVTRRQLLAAGLSRDEVQHRVDIGLLRREYPGVYRVGPLTTEARYLAAVKACGEGALLSGIAAAHLFDLIEGPAPKPHVTTRTERRIAGIQTRRSSRICADHATRFRGIPITTIPQILIDLAPILSLDDLARACHEAGIRGTRPDHVEAILRANEPGAKKLRAVLRGDIPVTLSQLEKRFLALLEEHGLPLPQTNIVATERRVDCRWPAHQLTVELDSYRFHNSRHAFENDRRREREAYARGDQHRRYTYGDVYEDPREMLAELRTVLPVTARSRTGQDGRAALSRSRPARRRG